MPSKLSIHVNKQDDIDNLASQSPLIYSKDKFRLQNPPLVAFIVKMVRFLCRN